MTAQNPTLLCPIHDSPLGGFVADTEVYACGCLVHMVNVYHDCAMGGECDPRWLKPDDWYALQVKTMAERAPA